LSAIVARALLASSALGAAAQAGAVAPHLAHLRNGIELTGSAGSMRVTALTDSIIRVRVAKDGKFGEDASWAVPAAVRHESVRVAPTARGFRTASMELRVDPATMKLQALDLHGTVISADSGPVRSDAHAFELRKDMPLSEHYFGMGDKTGVLDRRGYTFVNWNSDTYGFTPSTDPIYKSIPFFIATGGPGGSYGLFLDNTYRSTFDFGHSVADTLRISSVDGPIDYYLIAGPTVADVVHRYTDLTGHAPMAPLWALGYQQSRYSYMSDAEVRQIATTFRRDRFPLDVIWLDIDYQDRNRPFTVNKSTFPNMPALVHDMGQLGIKLVPITDLHVAYLPNQGYAPYDSGAAGNNFVHDSKGNLYVAPVWPGPSVFPDFTRASTRAWWGSLYKDFIADGFAGFWNDMNEPAVFDTPGHTMPNTNLHRIESDDFAPRMATHAEIHNVYGMENTRGTYEGMLRLRPGVRPFVMTRASYAGGQRYAATWTGDNSSTWDHLRLSVEQLINLGLSGFSYSGSDVGGFTGGPSPELLTRWFEVAAFTPVFRDHSAKDTPRAEPWVDGPEQLAIRKRYVEERYKLLPYIYALAEQNSRTGDPLMRPVFYDYPDALNSGCDQSMSFTLGRSLLIAGPPKPESPEKFDICLPKGGWYDYWTGLPVTQAKLTETPKLDVLRVFVRAGTILPRQPVVQSTAELPKGPLMLDIYPGENCIGEIYADDGTSIAGATLKQEISCSITPRGLSLRFGQRTGTYRPWWNAIAVTVHGWSNAPARVSNGTNAVADRPQQTVAFTIPDHPEAGEVTVGS
jgi:alpha-glucosidase